MKNVLYGLLLILTISIIFQACKKEEPGPSGPTIDLTLVPYQNLSEYNFFKDDIANLEPVSGLIPYDLNMPLFTNYAQKSRFLWIPEGETAQYTEEGVLEFPDRTFIIKNFHYDNDFNDPSKGRRILETRLLYKINSEWEVASYIWNESQTDAVKALVGDQVQVEWKHSDGNQRSELYVIPTVNDCKGCHNIDNVLLPIGPKARNLNRSFDYAEGAMNQLDKMAELGKLSGLASNVPSMPLWGDESRSLDERARGYLDINCGHCHNPQGPAKNSGLTLIYEETNPASYGICKPPVAAGQGSGGLSYGIVPGAPDESIMVYRMESLELDVMMPELGRSTNHQEGIDLIREWVSSLEGDCM